MEPPRKVWIILFALLINLAGVVLFLGSLQSTWQILVGAWESSHIAWWLGIPTAIGILNFLPIPLKLVKRWKGPVTLLFIIAFVLFLAYQTYRVTPGTFTVTDLGTLGGSTSTAIDINNSGQVVGNSQIAGERGSSQHAVMWKRGVLGSAEVMMDLGTLLGKLYSSASGVNSSPQIIGSSGATGTDSRAFLYSGSTMMELGTLGGTESGASDINDANQVVGWSHIKSSTSVHAFLYSGGVMTDMGTLGGDRSEASAINNSGQVVGSSSTAGNAATRAFIYDDGSLKDIGTLGGDHSGAADISDNGQVVGRSHIPRNTGSHAFLWDNGVMTDLGTLGGTESSASGVNNRGQVVGSLITSGTSPTGHAFVWDSVNGMYDINPAGWSSSFAMAINDLGEIVGGGKNPEGLDHAFLLTPVSAGPAFFVLGQILVVLVWGMKMAVGEQVSDVA